MPAADLLAALEGLPRLGWVTGPPPPVTPLPELAAALGLAWLGAKRDDTLPALHGGSKVRKLDYLLAAEPWRDAATWASAGAIGSGHLVALTAAAEQLARRVEAWIFWEPLSAGVVDNLAAIATGASALHYRRNRVSLALRDAALLLGGTRHGLPVIPPGGSAPPGVAGLVRAGLEIAAQVESGEVPPFDRLVVPLGSGGNVAGLALGLALAGLRPVVHAVTAVERPFTSRARLLALVEATRAWLAERGVGATAALPPIEIDRRRIGRGYGHPTPESKAACTRVAELPLEPVYSGKAMAALLAGAARPGERVLFWVTPRRPEPIATAPDWRDRLPPALRRRLEGPDRGRRRLAFAALGGAAAVALGVRVSGYPALAWDGQALAAWEAHVLRAAAESLLPPLPGPFDDVPAPVDRYVRALPPGLRREVHLLLATVEHGTVLDLRWRRLTALDVPDRLAFFEALRRRGGMQGLLYRCVRDLCLLARYQQPAAWPALGYPGPMVSSALRPDNYDGLRAPDGALPRGWSTAA